MADFIYTRGDSNDAYHGWLARWSKSTAISGDRQIGPQTPPEDRAGRLLVDVEMTGAWSCHPPVWVLAGIAGSKPGKQNTDPPSGKHCGRVTTHMPSTRISYNTHGPGPPHPLREQGEYYGIGRDDYSVAGRPSSARALERRRRTGSRVGSRICAVTGQAHLCSGRGISLCRL